MRHISEVITTALTEFQFTHPGRGATRETEKDRNNLVVSIHAPWEGCDDELHGEFRTGKVSIHAPWEGCDFGVNKPNTNLRKFQFTHPGRGATIELSVKS